MPDGIGKIPPWAWALAAVAGGAGLWLYKKQKQSSEISEASLEGEPQPYIAGLENPAEEFPYSMGGGGLGGAIAGAGESQAEFHELFGAQQTFEKEFAIQQSESQKVIAQEIREGQEAITRILGESTHAPGTTTAQGQGGGAPSEPTPGGTTSAPPPPTAKPSCPAAFPEHNPAKGAVGAHSCFRQSRTKTGGGCGCHGYQDGHLECETGKAPKCHW
jgi:hypothetical protein